MKICPVCQQTYNDDYLNFCLSDGATLENAAKDDAPPTVYMDRARTTNEMNWRGVSNTPPASAPMSPWQNPSMQQPSAAPNQMYSPPAAYAGNKDQTLPIISLVLGILSAVICCYGGIPFGIPAIVTGFLGYNNVNKNPQQYGGRELAMAGMVLGAVGLLITLFFILIAIIGG